MPSSIFSCQTALNKDKFLEFGIKNANRAILVLTTPKVESRKKVFFFLQKESQALAPGCILGMPATKRWYIGT